MSLVDIAITGDLSAYAKDFNKSLARAVTKAVRSSAGIFRSNVKKQITKNFADATQLPKTLFKTNTPKSGYVLNPVSTIVPKALYQAGKAGRAVAVDLIDLYTTSGIVHAANKQWLAVPTKEAPMRAGRGGSRYAMPSEAGVKFAFLPTRDPNKAVLVPAKWTRKGKRPVVYVLLKQTTRRARLDTVTEMNNAAGQTTQLFEANWAQETATLEGKYGT